MLMELGRRNDTREHIITVFRNMNSTNMTWCKIFCRKQYPMWASGILCNSRCSKPRIFCKTNSSLYIKKKKLLMKLLQPVS